MSEYTTGYMCDWCKASAATLNTIVHERDCQRPMILQMMEDLASLHVKNASLRAANEKLRAFVRHSQCEVTCTPHHPCGRCKLLGSK